MIATPAAIAGLTVRDREVIERFQSLSRLPEAERRLERLREYAESGDPEAIQLLAEIESRSENAAL